MKPAHGYWVFPFIVITLYRHLRRLYRPIGYWIIINYTITFFYVTFDIDLLLNLFNISIFDKSGLTSFWIYHRLCVHNIVFDFSKKSMFEIQTINQLPKL